ncbi:hypothetical protein K488DRAFT_82040 [Vararia minispora EC-137]|uniref:Uncharacterized protein n=1 Tax=Vararia minispora EC-137 TaxID=1314806 RepID=A0ACB8QYT4_9AGAM|nr:hypothetical protein K488DRAFT_82040 [Vararia minispora EC-137]
MDDYARAAARVHAALIVLQRAPEDVRSLYADEFTRELYEARSIRKRHGLNRMPFIHNLTVLIANCKPQGQYGIIPTVFAREIARFNLQPDTHFNGNLGENQWWLRLALPPPGALEDAGPDPDGDLSGSDSTPSTPPLPASSPRAYFLPAPPAPPVVFPVPPPDRVVVKQEPGPSVIPPPPPPTASGSAGSPSRTRYHEGILPLPQSQLAIPSTDHIPPPPHYGLMATSPPRKRRADAPDGPYHGGVIDARPPEDKFKFEMWSHQQAQAPPAGPRPPAKYARYNPDDPSPPKGYELTTEAERCSRCQERNIECWRGKKRKRASGACWNCHKLKRPCSMAKDWFAAKQFSSLAETFENDPGHVVVLQLNESGSAYSSLPALHFAATAAATAAAASACAALIPCGAFQLLSPKMNPRPVPPPLPGQGPPLPLGRPSAPEDTGGAAPRDDHGRPPPPCSSSSSSMSISGGPASLQDDSSPGPSSMSPQSSANTTATASSSRTVSAPEQSTSPSPPPPPPPQPPTASTGSAPQNRPWLI